MNFFFPQSTDAAFRFARIQEPGDWFWPILVTLLLLYWVRRRYVIDGSELKRWQRTLSVLLRTGVIIALLLYYLHPQWERVVGASRVAILIDSSASMSTRDIYEENSQEEQPVANIEITTQTKSSAEKPAVQESAETVPSRLDQAVHWLRQSELIEKLREKHDVVVYRFDNSLVRLSQQEQKTEQQTGPEPSDTAWTGELLADGTETRLGESLRELLHRERGQPLSGVLLLSDGRLNKGETVDAACDAAKTAKIPIHTLGFGLKELPLNFRVLHVDAPDRVFPNDPFQFKSYVEIQGGEQDQNATSETMKVAVELWSDRETSEEQQTLAENIGGEVSVPSSAKLLGKQEIEMNVGSRRSVDFEVQPDELGKYKFYLKIVPPDEEDRIPDDNIAVAAIEVVDRKDRVLLFTGGPMRDYQFLSNQLFRDKSVQVDSYLPWASSGISQSVDQVLDSFPSSTTEMAQYDCVVAFDPDWRLLSPQQVEVLENWVVRLGGGLIVVAGPVYLADSVTGWTSDPGMDKIRAMYPVDVSSRSTSSGVLYRTDVQPWPLKWERTGEEAPFLRPVDSDVEARAIWGDFAGFYSFFIIRRVKPAATLYASSSSPDVVGSGGSAPIFVEQYYGAGRVFYIGSPELWRLRMLEDEYFEKLYTKLIRHVSQGRLQRSGRGSLSTDKKQYTLGSTATVRATVYDSQFKPLQAPNLDLDIVQPDAKVRQISLSSDPQVPGSYFGYIPLLLEGNWSLRLQIPDIDQVSASEGLLMETIQVRISELESENPSRNEALLLEIAQKTDGEYFASPSKVQFEPGQGGSFWEKFAVRSQRSVLDSFAEEYMMEIFLYVLCALLCAEWTFRRLFRLA